MINKELYVNVGGFEVRIGLTIYVQLAFYFATAI